MRVVLDANVLISALITPKGAMGQLIASWRAGAFDLLLSPAICAEIERVAGYPRIQARYALPAEQIAEFMDLLTEQAVMIEPQIELHVVTDDPDDDKYVECAVAGRAAVIVSGDRHLTKLRAYRDILILDPKEFIAFLRLGKTVNLS